MKTFKNSSTAQTAGGLQPFCGLQNASTKDDQKNDSKDKCTKYNPQHSIGFCIFTYI